MKKVRDFPIVYVRTTLLLKVIFFVIFCMVAVIKDS